ncbi:hypothetical protein [Modestobacter sp. I12A-02662]|uniref:hypothetical protein n=1 Tax=Modestobacter sp. I12A-02662 TaxID=1730496 RepID=UPI0034DF51F7
MIHRHTSATDRNPDSAVARRRRVLGLVTATTAATAGLAALAPPANADVLTPNGIQVHTRADCIAITNTIELTASPDPERASARVFLRDVATGQDFAVSEFRGGVQYPALGWTTYTFEFPEFGLGDVDAQVYVEYWWQTDAGGFLHVGEWLPDPCYV